MKVAILDRVDGRVYVNVDSAVGPGGGEPVQATGAALDAGARPARGAGDPGVASRIAAVGRRRVHVCHQRRTRAGAGAPVSRWALITRVRCRPRPPRSRGEC
jgi:hypothetical protein